MTALVNIKRTVSTFEERLTKLQKQLEVEIHKAFKEFFKTTPEVKMIAWTQYTPYFMDGDECIFSVNEMYFCKKVIEVDNIYDLEDDEEEIVLEVPYWYSEKPKNELDAKCQDFSNALHSAENFMQTTFGDHVTILATKKGFDIREYEHD